MKLLCRGVTVQYGHFTALSNVDLELAAGRRLSIVGPSGCGKSTLLRAIAGLAPIANGSVWRDGHDITALRPHERGVGLMFQEHALFPHHDVAGNIGFGLRMQEAMPDDIDVRVEEMLELVGLAERRTSRIDELSGGERQRVALARTLAPGPELVLLDEPLASLDRVLRRDLLEEITTIFADLEMTVVAVTHDIDEAFRFGTDLAVMAPARIDRSGPAPDVWNDPQTTYTASFLGYAPVAPLERNASGVTSGIGPVATAPERATHVAVAPDGFVPDPEGDIVGVVLRTSFEQGRWRNVVRIAGSDEVVVHTMRRHEAGEIRLRVDAESIRFVQPTSSAV